MSLEISFSCVFSRLGFSKFCREVSESRIFVCWLTVSIKTMIKLFIIWRRVFHWELNHSQIPSATSSGTRVAYFPYVTFVSVVSFNDVTIPAFWFC